MLCPCRHHTIRFVCAFRHQIVDENAYIRLVATKNERFLPVDLPCGVYTCDKSLRGGFFVSAAAVHLPCREQTFYVFVFKGRIHTERVETIVFYCIAVFCKAAIFKPGQSAIHRLLHVVRQRRGHALNVHFFTVRAFGFDENLMTLFVFETHNFRFYGRAISRAHGQNRSVVQGRAVYIGENNLVRFRVRVREIARLFFKSRVRRHKRKSVAVVSVLYLHF